MNSPFRMSFRTDSLKTRITLVSLGIFLAAVWSLSFYTSRMLREDMQRVLGEQQFSAVSFMAAGINDELIHRQRSMESVARKITPAMMGNTKALQAFLEDRTVLQDLFNGGLIAVDAEGTTIADFPLSTGRIGANYMDRDHISGALRNAKATTGRPFMGRALLAPIFGMAVPILDAQGRVIGALAGVTDLGKPSFLDKISQNRYGKTGDYFLTARQHRLIITSSDKSRIMESLPAPGVNPMIDRVIDGYEGSLIYVNPRGMEQLASAKGIPVAGWYVAVALPTAEAFAPLHALQERMLLATVFLTLFAGGLIWWMLRRQFSPLLATAKTVACLSDTGQNQQALAIARQDEIGDLIGGFNRLLKVLQQRESALKESEARYRLLADQVSDVLWVMNLETGCMVYVSPSVERLRGYSVEEVLAQPVDQVMTAESHAKVRTWIAERKQLFLAGGEGPHTYVDEVEQTRKDGSTVWTEAATRYVRNERGELILVGVSRDIAERKRLERERGQYFRFFLLTTDAMCIADPFGCFKQVNPAMVRLTGYSEGELVAKPFLDFVLPEDRQRTADEMELQVAVRPSMQFDNRYVRKDGSVLLLSWTAYYDKEEGVTYATARDITEIRQAQESIQASSQHSRSLIEASLDPLLTISAEGRITDVNTATERVTGMNRADLIGSDFANYFTDPVKAREGYQQVFAQGFVTDYPLAIRHLSGRITDVLYNASVYRDADGKVLGVFAAARDITRRKQTEAELLRSNAELERFSYSISHDMRQPLRMISSYLQLLDIGLADKLDAEKREYLNFAADGAKRLDQMLVGLLEYSRIGRKGEPPAWVESRAILDEALLYLQPAITEAGADVRIGGDWPRLFVSPDEMLRLAQNLIGNAIKFRVAGRGPVIRVTGARVGDEWRMSVADNGTGMIPEQIGRLFQVFQRLHSRATYEGSGIGLALCRKIAEHHRGRIWAESEGEGCGSTFSVQIPIAPETGASVEPQPASV